MTTEKTKALAIAIVGREQEVGHYQLNKNNYEIILKSLPTGKWAEELVKYKTTKIEELPEEMELVDVQIIADLQYRDKLRNLVRTETIEMGKTQRVMDALISQIPKGKYDAAITEGKAFIEAQIKQA